MTLDDGVKFLSANECDFILIKDFCLVKMLYIELFHILRKVISYYSIFKTSVAFVAVKAPHHNLYFILACVLEV